MSKLLGQYSNGWGHLIMSVVSLLFLGMLYIFGGPTTPRDTLLIVAGGIISFWFGSGIANRFNQTTANHASATGGSQQPTTLITDIESLSGAIASSVMSSLSAQPITTTTTQAPAAAPTVQTPVVVAVPQPTPQATQFRTLPATTHGG